MSFYFRATSYDGFQFVQLFVSARSLARRPLAILSLVPARIILREYRAKEMP